MASHSFVFSFLVTDVAPMALPVPPVTTQHIIVGGKTPGTGHLEVIPAPEKITKTMITQDKTFTSNPWGEV